ncbi:hypothetical protein ACFLX9_04260, partial [Chloroflexota bacterium]
AASMSKLLDRLYQITRGAPRAMGFATAANQEAIPTLALLTWMGGPGKNKVAPLVGAGVDAFILPRGVLGVAGLERQLKPLEGSTWGIVMEQPERDRVEAYQDKGCDFVAFGIEETRVDALEEGECGRILRIPTDLEDSLLRGLEDLPVDIILLCKPAPEGPLSLVHLLAISNVRSATGRYLLLEWNSELTSRELEHLRDAGVDGLVVNVEEVQPSVITTLRERINVLPRRKAKGEQRPFAVLPPTRGIGDARPQRQEEEEEEE